MKTSNLIDRSRAAGAHLLFSAVLLCIALYLVFALWYPAPLHKAAGVTKVYQLMLAIDLLLGPLLTFIVFKEDKRKLFFDLTVILTLQVSAFVYGLYAVAQGRPAWLVFVVDDIELVRVIDIDLRKHAEFKDEFKTSILVGPRWAAATYSSNPATLQAQREDEMFNGISLAQRPETFRELPIAASKMIQKGHALDDLEMFNPADMVADTLAQWPSAYSWLPLKSPEIDMTVLLDNNGKVVAVVDLRPW